MASRDSDALRSMSAQPLASLSSKYASILGRKCGKCDFIREMLLDAPPRSHAHTIPVAMEDAGDRGRHSIFEAAVPVLWNQLSSGAVYD